LDSILLYYDVHPSHREAFDKLAARFFGRIGALPDSGVAVADLIAPVTYFCGDMRRLDELSHEEYSRVRPVEDLCHHVGAGEYVDIDQVPIDMHGVGVLVPDAFSSLDHFTEVRKAHRFYNLTESNKAGKSFRKGVYITDVKEETREGGAARRFSLLRCSSNLDGPTEGLQAVDRHILQVVNQLVGELFTNAAEVNHVLAQVYENTPATSENGERKARIKRHSDKTKDMPANGVIAFCSFYSTETKDERTFTRLRFRLKDDANEIGRPSLEANPEAKFDVLLRPNSVFIIPLSTNRLYTHEIVPPALPAHMLPTRLGYVARCSATTAIFRDGQVYLNSHGSLVPLKEPQEQEVSALKSNYLAENTTSKEVSYGKLDFSLNNGDYMCPI
jgi:hypothetical protein